MRSASSEGRDEADQRPRFTHTFPRLPLNLNAYLFGWGSVLFFSHPKAAFRVPTLSGACVPALEAAAEPGALCC